MYKFKAETQGLHTYLVSEIDTKEMIDTVGIGMLSNNNIKGLLSMSQMYIDNICILKYNISSKVTMKQYLSGKVNKNRILKTFSSIVETVQLAENYMLDVDLLLMQKENIYVNVGNSEVELLYFPLLKAKQTIDLPQFFKTILFETEFEQSENCDYVTSLINFLNRNGGFSITEFKQLLEGLIQTDIVKQAKPIISISKAEPIHEMPIPQVIPANVSYISAAPLQKEKKKLFLFGKKDKIKTDKIKTVKKEKKNDIKATKGKEKSGYVPSMEIPGMQRTTNREPVEKTNYQKPETETAKTETSNYRSTYHFGETTVLHMAQAGETTVLGMDDQTILQPTLNPYLVRKSNGEKILITKNAFHLGKEKNYADYCINDNSAVSRSHADILIKGEDFFIVDNNSLNHTYLNGEQISSQTPILLGENSIIKLANEEFEFRL